MSSFEQRKSKGEAPRPELAFWNGCVPCAGGMHLWAQALYKHSSLCWCSLALLLWSPERGHPGLASRALGCSTVQEGQGCTHMVGNDASCTWSEMVSDVPGTAGSSQGVSEQPSLHRTVPVLGHVSPQGAALPALSRPCPRARVQLLSQARLLLCGRELLPWCLKVTEAFGAVEQSSNVAHSLLYWAVLVFEIVSDKFLLAFR